MTQTTDQKQFYHWKKNIDSKFIAGEDLQASLNGLKPEMTVVIEKFGEADSFDQNTQKNKVVTDLFMKEVGGTSLYKPAVLNKTNARFFVAEFNSDNVWDWLNKPVIMFSKADRRHRYVVRFRSAPAAVKFDNKAGLDKMGTSKTLAELEANWKALAPEMQNDSGVRALTSQIKQNFVLADLYAAKKAKLGISDQRNYERILTEKEVDSYAKMKTELEAIK